MSPLPGVRPRLLCALYPLSAQSLTGFQIFFIVGRAVPFRDACVQTSMLYRVARLTVSVMLLRTAAVGTEANQKDTSSAGTNISANKPQQSPRCDTCEHFPSTFPFFFYCLLLFLFYWEKYLLVTGLGSLMFPSFCLQSLSTEITHEKCHHQRPGVDKRT